MLDLTIAVLPENCTLKLSHRYHICRLYWPLVSMRLLHNRPNPISNGLRPPHYVFQLHAVCCLDVLTSENRCKRERRPFPQESVSDSRKDYDLWMSVAQVDNRKASGLKKLIASHGMYLPPLVFHCGRPFLCLEKDMVGLDPHNKLVVRVLYGLDPHNNVTTEWKQ